MYTNKLDVKVTEYISQFKNLTTLEIDDNNIGAEGAFQLTDLDISRNGLDIGRNQTVVRGAQALGELKQLTCLYISTSQIGTAGAKIIGGMKKLTELDIAFNKIGDEGAKYISKLELLQNVDILRNLLTEEGVRRILKESKIKTPTFKSQMKELLRLKMYI